MSDFEQEVRAAYERAATELEYSPGELRRKLFRLEWGVREVMRAVRAEDWTTKFRAELIRADDRITAQTETKIATAIRETFESGPMAMVELDCAKVRALLPDKLRHFVDEYSPEDGNRIIVGPTGWGKTLALVALGKRLVRARIEADVAKVVESVERGGNPLSFQLQCVSIGGPFLWTRAVDLAKARREHSLGGGEAPLVLEGKKACMLVVDDWGWEPEKDTTIPELLAERYDNKRVTLITSALSPAELQARYGAAVIRRALGDPETGKVLSLFQSKPVAVAGGSK